MGLHSNSGLFYGLFVMKATLAFWTTETLRVTDVTTYGGRDAGQFPVLIFPMAFRLFFTVVIPIACVAYYPVAAVLGKESICMWLALFAPVAGAIFLFLACRLWHVGVRRYCSVGS
jgi:ABC-2 type transport system permease protein